jgi:hypothetical protein
MKSSKTNHPQKPGAKNQKAKAVGESRGNPLEVYISSNQYNLLYRKERNFF